jgi:hypothetical protein
MGTSARIRTVYVALDNIANVVEGGYSSLHIVLNASTLPGTLRAITSSDQTDAVREA